MVPHALRQHTLEGHRLSVQVGQPTVELEEMKVRDQDFRVDSLSPGRVVGYLQLAYSSG